MLFLDFGPKNLKSVILTIKSSRYEFLLNYKNVEDSHSYILSFDRLEFRSSLVANMIDFIFLVKSIQIREANFTI